MARPLTELGELGGRVSAALEEDGGARARAIETARQGLLADALRPERKPRFQARLLLGVSLGTGALACAAAAALWWSGNVLQDDPLSFRVDGQVGVAEKWLAAPSARPLDVRFSDGTQLRVDPTSRVRVVETAKDGAHIALEGGGLEARVVHTGHSNWQVNAGPFAIRVTGTRFDLHWDPASQRLSLAVLEGSVAVSGSIVGAERPVHAGEKLLASVVQGQLELQRLDQEAKPLPARSAAEPSSEVAGVAKAERVPGSAAVLDKDREAWRELAKSGDLRRAFAAADARGFQGVCEGASAAELLLLGDAARVSGRADRATEALLTLRRRFPHDARRAAAAFALGKVAFDQRHAYAQAAEWFATCVREQPSGTLSREASGRRIEALKSAGDRAGAERAARDYLVRYPDGPHAEVARSLLK